MKKFGTVERNGQWWVVKCEPHVTLRLKRLFLKIDKGDFGYVKLSDTEENCRDLTWFLERYPMDVPEMAYLEKRSRDHLDLSERLSQIVGGDYEPRKFELTFPPRKYQSVAAEALLQGKSLLVADDMGLGKTITAITALTDPKTRPAMVVTMTHLPLQWKAELNKFAPTLRVHILKTGRPYDLLKEKKGRRTFDVPFPDVIVGSYSKLSGWADVLGGRMRSVVFDEIQELRHSTSEKYKAAKHIADGSDYKLGLSGTPIYNYGSEIFNVVDVLKPMSLGTRDEFLREWCIGGDPMGRNDTDKEKIKDPRSFGLYMREQALMIRRTRRDVGREMPKCTRIPHMVDADMAALDKVESSATELAKIIMTQRGEGNLKRGEKLHAAEQLSSLLRQATGVAKAPYVAEFARMVVEGGEPLVLFGWHREVYSIWMEKLKDLKPVMYTGSESITAKAAAAKDFIEGRANLLIMSLRSGAGLDGLQRRCRTVAFGELDWSPAVHEQNIKRVDRDGQTDPVTGYFLLSDHGVDPVMSDVLGLKMQQIEGIRNPKMSDDLLEKLEVDPGNIRKLAEQYLIKRGLHVASPPVPKVVEPSADFTATMAALKKFRIA